jgi:hypothetical protein
MNLRGWSGMRHGQAIVAFVLISAAAKAYAIADLTPTVAEYKAEGITYRQLIFKDGQQDVSYDLPPRWSYRFDGGRILLTPTDVAFAEASIEAVPLPKPQPFDRATTEKLNQQVLTTLPPNSEAIAITKSEQNPVLLNSNLSYEIAVSYKTMGNVFQRSVLFVNAPGTQLIFRLSARKSDFDRLYSIFRASVFTWQWVEAAAADVRHAPANEQSGSIAKEAVPLPGPPLPNKGDN